MPALLHRVSLLLALAWAGVLFYLSHQPGLGVPPLFSGQDKLVHAAAYAVLGVFVAGALRPVDYGYSRRQAWLAVAVVASYGILDEFHQYFVPGRSMDIFDMLADAAGGLLGIALVMYAVGRLPGTIRDTADRPGLDYR